MYTTMGLMTNLSASARIICDLWYHQLTKASSKRHLLNICIKAFGFAETKAHNSLRRSVTSVVHRMTQVWRTSLLWDLLCSLDRYLLEVISSSRLSIRDSRTYDEPHMTSASTEGIKIFFILPIGSTTRSTSPIFLAFAALMLRPMSIMSKAFGNPT